MSLNQLRSALSRGTEFLGDLVWWSLSDASIDRTTLETRWSNASLDPNLLPEPPSAEKVLKTAVRESSIGHPDRLIRLAREDETQLIYGVVAEERHTDGALTYKQEARVILAKVTETITTDQPNHDIAQAVISAFIKNRSLHTCDDVRRTIVKTLHHFSAVTLREGGGVYWVPRTSSEPLRRLEGCIEGIGGSKFHVLPVHQSGEGNQVLGEVAKQSLESELSDLQHEIATFKSEAPRRSTLTNRIDAFEDLRARAELYRSILAVNVDVIDTGLAELAIEVESMLLEKAA